MKRRGVTARAILAALVLLAPAALADLAAETDAPALTIHSASEGRKLLSAARADVTRLRGTLDRRRRQLESSLRVMPEYRQAVAERDRARSAYDAARQPALAAVRTGEAYREAQGRLARANAALAAASRAVRLGGLRSLAADVREASAAVRDIEDHAVAANPSAAAAAAVLEEAEAKVAALRAEHVEQALADDQVCMSARSALARAEARLAAVTSAIEQFNKPPPEEKEPEATPSGYAGLQSRLKPRTSVEDYARGVALQRAAACSGPV